MNLFDFFILVLSAFALSLIIFLLFQILFPSASIVTNQPVPTRWWPWSVTSYNYWPVWMGVSGGGASGSSSGSSKSYQERCPSGSCRPSSSSPFSRPWGGAERGANGGGFYHTSSAPSAPSAPSPSTSSH